MRSCSQGLIATVLCGLLIGCGGSDADKRLVPVSGKVTFNGQPVASGVVGMISTDGKGIYSGTITSGSYAMQASQSGKGIPPGDYRVRIQAWATEPSMDADGKPVPGKEAIPKKYFETGSSGLTATVPSGGGTVNFDLKP